jgi:phosphoglycolate phosphatase
VRGVVGLSLPIAVARLAGDAPAEAAAAATEAYRAAFVRLRAESGGEAAAPLFPGARESLERLEAAGCLLAVATGKARRGLEHALDAHDLRRFFVTTQCADDAPSKPHPGMVLNALSLTGAEAADTAVVGDATFDVEMARAAGARAIGVGWGNHPPAALRAAGAETVIDRFDALDAALDALWEAA